MASAERELQEQLVEAGNRLLQPPSPADELLPLLDQVENFLSRVEQSPSKSMQTALSPSMKALVADELLKHPDEDVKVAVASCISEITRITAPDAPYDDEQMKDVFQLIVSSFENLCDKSSRSYSKRTLILETVAKVRSCVVMLDLECDGLIVKMFQHFLKAIRDYHPDNVFSSMETIMTLVLEESEDISFDLISPILSTMKRDNQDVLPIARRLGERVFENCGLKLKPYLIQAKKSLGFSLDDYSKVVASICDGTTGAVGQNDGNACGEQLADENKLAVASPDEAAQDKLTKESVTESHTEGDLPAVDRTVKSVVSNGVAEAGNEDILAVPESSKKLELPHQSDQSVDTNVPNNVEPDDLDSGNIVKSESKSEQTSKKRGRKPSTLINSTEPSDSSRVDSDKEAERMSDHRKSRSKEVHSSPSEEPSVEVAVPLENEKETVQLSTPEALGSEPMNAASPSPSGSVPDEGRPRKTGRPKTKDNLIKDVAPSVNVVSKNASEGTSDSEVKPQRRSRKKAPVGSTTEEKTLADASKSEGGTTSDSEAKPLKQSLRKVDAKDNIGDVSSPKKKHNLIKDVAPSANVVSKNASEGTSDSEVKPQRRSRKKAPVGSTTEEKTPADASKSEGGTTSDSEAKPSKQSLRKVDAKDNIGDVSSSKKKEDVKRRGRGRGRGKATKEKDVTKSSIKADDKEMVSSPNPASKLAKDEGHLEKTPKMSSKRKRMPGKEKASDTIEYGDNLVGSKVKVWWPDDHMFYEGVIDSFNSVKKKHKVLYTDGDEETLNLSIEKWEFVGGGSDGEEDTECRSSDHSTEMHKKKKAKTNSEPSAKQGKMECSRGGEASSSKLKEAATKSGRKARDDDKLDGKSKYNTSKSGSKSEEDGGKSKDRSQIGKSIGDAPGAAGKSKDSTKSKLDTPKTASKDTPKTATKSRGKASKNRNKSNANGSGKVKSGSVKGKETKGKEMSSESVKTPESAKGKSPDTLKGQETGVKSGKKRRRRG